MIQHGDTSPSDPKKLAVFSVYSPARATHLGLRFGVTTRGIRSKKSTENSKSFQVFPTDGLPLLAVEVQIGRVRPGLFRQLRKGPHQLFQ